MTLGRTSSGAIKIKTDGGLRAVSCACCAPIDFDPCRDCPPVLGDWNFSVAGAFPVTDIYNYQTFEEDYGNGPRVCYDTFDAYSYDPHQGSALVGAYLERRGVNLADCSWHVGLGVTVEFYAPATFIDSYGGQQYMPDFYFFGEGYAEFTVTSNSPVGSYNVTALAAPLRADYHPEWTLIAPAEPLEFIYTFTIE